jgi:UDP-N-acetyl-D-mannosaminuronic acid dehydrogenase
MALKSSSKDTDVVVMGLGYVGLTLGAYLSELGFKVHGVEIRDLVLNALESRKSFFFEPGLDELLSRNIQNGNFSFSRLIPKVEGNRVFVITVGTPIDEHKKAILDSIINVSEQVSHSMTNGDMVILRSTVRLNTTKSIVDPILKKSGKDFDLAFCPERTLEGAALKELGSLPQIIGADLQRSRARATNFFQQVTSSVVNVSNIETAEMIKLVDNMQRDVFFAVSNEVAHLCNSQQIKASEVISAGKLGYGRTNLANPGPVGGPCLEKDSYLLAESFDNTSATARIALAARFTNESVTIEAAEFISSWVKQNTTETKVKISVLGMAFKGVPETNDMRGTPAISLIDSLVRLCPDLEIKCWDPVVTVDELKSLGYDAPSHIQECIEQSSVVILVNNHPVLSTLDLKAISASAVKPILIYDFWGRSDHNLNLEGLGQYFSWGNHSLNAQSKGVTN